MRVIVCLGRIRLTWSVAAPPYRAAGHDGVGLAPTSIGCDCWTSENPEIPETSKGFPQSRFSMFDVRAVVISARYPMTR